MGEIARAQEIYVRIARDPELAQHDKYCPLDEWVLAFALAVKGGDGRG
jgi:hypothetical protein